MNDATKHSQFAETPLTRPGRFPISSSVVSGIALLIDSIAILAVGIATYAALINVNSETIGIYSASVCSIWITILMLFQFSELYRFDAIVRPFYQFDKVVISYATAFLFLLAAAFAFKVSSTISRLWIGSFGTAAFLLTIAARLALARLVLRLARQGLFARNMIIVGGKGHVTRLLDRMLRVRPEFVSVTGLFIDGPSQSVLAGYPVMGRLDDIAPFVRASRVDDIVIALPWSAEQRILALVDQLRELPVNVYLGSDLIGLRLDFGEPPGHFASSPIFSVIGQPMSGWGVVIKLVEDYLIGALALLLSLPPMALIALAIKMDSPGPVLFRQKRFGFNNQVFDIYKFRTMHHAQAPETATVQASPDDPRVTRLGRLLRRSSLDELPQLFNVLNGTMSLVGPRPHAVDHNEEYARKIRGYFARHRVKPGITGWAQVNGLRGETRTADKMEARVRHDIYYAENWSLIFDLRILFQTTVVWVTGRNAY